MTSPHAITSTLGSILRLLPRWLRAVRPGEMPEASTPSSAWRPDEGAMEWFGALVHERLRRSLAERTARDWEALYPGATMEERAARHIAGAARRAALTGGLSAAGAHVGEALTILTEGLTAPMCVPAVVAAIGAEVVTSAKVQIDLVFDLASIHGVAFDVSDTAELATIFDLALHGGRASAAGGEPRPSNGDAMLARLGRGLLEDALLGLVPFVGIPFSAVHGHRATARVGAVACRHLRGRIALREARSGAPAEG